MRFSGKVCLMTKLKVTKNLDFNLLLKDALLEKPQGVILTRPHPTVPPPQAF